MVESALGVSRDLNAMLPAEPPSETGDNGSVDTLHNGREQIA